MMRILNHPTGPSAHRLLVPCTAVLLATAARRSSSTERLLYVQARATAWGLQVRVTRKAWGVSQAPRQGR